MTEIIFASHNQGKIKEAQALLEPFGYQVLSADDLHLEDVEDNGTTFTDNALIKARAAFKATGKPARADDSGLCVHALGDEPG
ncbi:MAG: non-canonical purine NTP pyrophosphatase, partial [Alphaproteobacteria bacterium]|nr:non-canonical purine NTP pyrophosphatase [Alphaproteobacteria bacterium]